MKGSKKIQLYFNEVVQSKNQEIADLKVKLNSLWTEKRQLEQNEKALNAAWQFETIANSYAERESEELKIRLRER